MKWETHVKQNQSTFATINSSFWATERIMIKQLIIVLLTLLLTPLPVAAKKISGKLMPDAMIIDSEKLILNGAVVRKGYFINLYVIGLYLKIPTTDAVKIVNADETMVLRIKIITSLITCEHFKAETLKGFEQSTDGNTASIKNEIDLFLMAFSNEINNQDLFEIQYQKNKGVSVYKNGQVEPVVVVKGLPIKKAIFGIWIGKGIDKDAQIFARALLGY
jgi:hypothetical protein